MKYIREHIITIVATVIIIVITGFIIYLMVDYVSSGKENEYENNLERCMLTYKDYDYCKYRSY